jgi:hypothetical protein
MSIPKKKFEDQQWGILSQVSTIFNTFSRNHTCTSKENLVPRMRVGSIHGKLHLYKFVHHPSSTVQKLPTNHHHAM